jgi:tetratricopeptide (TPR) repeat protein
MNDSVRRRAHRRIRIAGPALIIWLGVATTAAAAQTVRGRLIDAKSGEPVKAAEMSLLSGQAGETVVKRGLTTDSGRFALTAPRPGRYRLKAERIGYRTVVSPPFDLVASEPLDVELKISSQAIPLAPLIVVSHRPALLGSIRLVANGFFEREEKWGPTGLHLGTFIDKETIERRQPTRVTDVLRMIPGVRVEHDSGDRWVVRMVPTSIVRGPCAPVLYLDGHPIRLVDERNGVIVQVTTIDDLLEPSSIAGMEVYPRISKPAEFTDMGADPCGAIVIWTGYAGSRGKGSGVTGGGSPMLGELPREDNNTRTAQRLLEQADTMDDESASRSVYQQALDAAHAAIAADTTNPLPRLQAGEAAIGVGDYKEADEQLGMAEKLWSIYQLKTQNIREKAWAVLQQRAAPLVSAGQYDQAIPIFEKANIIYRERPEVMLALGQLYGQEGKNDRALANLDSAALIIQDSAKLASVDSATAADWKNRLDALEVTRAEALSQAGRYDESIDEFRKLVQKHPDDIGYRRSLASLYVNTGKDDEAKQMYTEMLQDTALTADDLYQIGVGFYHMSDYRSAVKGFSGAAQRRPKDRDALEMWTRSLAMDSVWAQVPPVADRWIALDPNNQTAYMLEARAVNQQGNGNKAQELVDRIRTLKVTVEDLNIQRGRKGAATVTGTMKNKMLASGAQVTITFTFYDDQGNLLGTQTQTVTLGAQGQQQNFTVSFNSDMMVGGYGYTLTTS